MRWFRRNVDQVLTEFFAVRRRGCAGPRLERVERVETVLRDCVEQAAEAVLDDGELALLDAERQFRPTGAAARVLAPAVLLEFLPLVLDDPRWRPEDPGELRVHVLTVGALVRHLLAEVQDPEPCVVHTVGAALDRAMRGAGAARPTVVRE
ncbi:hypothetical protein QDR37_11575 [Amnibacterium sp. CER49]|uniref:hypothetical protein n=1 Tax=Amnibacterium sp. CER49 TaxID=3039161 RepID=UPI00244BBBA9|nr:hypothetical protein [Amnibacterium sp. CER49]MDH2444585.1 hypothetical protein [Amnibacterium sp. CER49]